MGTGRILRKMMVGMFFIALAGCVVIPSVQTPAPPSTDTSPVVPSTESQLSTEIQATPTLATLPSELPQPTQPRVTENEPSVQTAASVLMYSKQYQTPLSLPNYAHPEAGCNWMGVAGQVFDAQGNPIRNILVNVGGVLNGKPVDLLGMTGLATNYGPAGYEMVLSTSVIASTGTLWVQLYDLSGNPISGKVVIDTYNDCQRNLILVNFVRHPEPAGPYRNYLPVIYQGQ